MMNKLLIIGASGHGKVIADIAKKSDEWEQILFIDDKSEQAEMLGYQVVGKVKDAWEYINECAFVVGIGDNFIRQSLQEDLESKGATIASLVHPSAIIGTDVSIGMGTVVMAGVVINSGTCIGRGCIINTSSSIDHDNTIGNYVHVSPGSHLAGTVNVGKNTWMGIGSVVSNNVNITSDCKIGAGAVVIKEINSPGTYVGVPARKI
ncbi:acetyltransferase [Halobacillus trueperi]|uniref:Acetyltransferase n=1 Tax=Halobacillus trueperi TaxID=156205 RepID=A0A3E0J826_9BACI|nr:acetyltransferase [Halobacillus trueperi]REJ08904.1 acetyltransferase [Halobacillus trueperi]